MRWAKFAFVAVVALLLVVAVTASQLVWDGYRTLLDPQFYVEVLDREGVYEEAAARARAVVAERISADTPDALRESFVNAVASVLEPEFFRQVSLTALDRVVGFVKGRYPDPAVTISLDEPRRAFVEAVLADIPAELIAQLRKQEGVPPHVSDTDFLLAQLPIPDQVSLTDLWGGGDLDPRIDQVVGLIRRAPVLAYGTAAALGLLLLVILGMKSGLRWVGGALLVSGVLVLVVLQMGVGTYGVELAGEIVAPEAVLSVLNPQRLVGAIIDSLGGSLQTVAAFTAGAGVCLLGLSSLLPARGRS